MQTQLIVRSLDRMGVPQPLETGMVYNSDADGRFRVEGVGRGTYLLVASAKGKARTVRTVEVSGGSVDGIGIILKRGTPVRLDPEPGDLLQFLITIRDSGGVPSYSSLTSGAWPVYLELAEGRYVIEVSDDAGLRRKIPLEVGSEAMSLVVRP